MWESMDIEKQDQYGRAYLDHQYKVMEEAVPTSALNVYPVLDAMTDALLAFKPKQRYLIPGSSKIYDVYKVCPQILPKEITYFLLAWDLTHGYIVSSFPSYHLHTFNK